MGEWVSLHNHTMFSLLDGCGRIQDFVAYAKQCGFKALGITDHGTCAGYLDFQALCLEHNIKPLFGIECYISPFEMTLKGLSDEEKDRLNEEQQKEENKIRSKNGHLILIAKNNNGLKTLYSLITAANQIGYYRRPRIDYDFLSKNHNDLICSTACLASRLNTYIVKNDIRAVVNEVKFLKGLFNDDLYLELEANAMKEQRLINAALIELSKQYDIKLIITNDAHYISKEYSKAHASLLKINSENSDWEFQAEDLCLMPYDEFYKHVKKNHSYIKDDILTTALANTVEIAGKCSALIDTKSKKEPIYITSDGTDNYDFMMNLLVQGIKTRGINKLPVNVDVAEETQKIKKFKFYYPPVKNMKQFYLDRLQYELKIIKEKGYVDYFLIVWDFIHHAKQNDMLIGPGRGSVGGSVLAWVLNLIELDPIEYKLSFERFLNPERSKNPDIDTDIEDTRRDELRKYLFNKWGENCVAPIVAYSRYSANSLFRDVCRLYNLEFMKYNEIAKTIDTGGVEMNNLKPFKQNVDENPQLKKFLMDLGLKGEEIIDLISKMEGQIKNTSIAAAGTIISNQPLQELIPLRRAKDKSLVTEWEGAKLSACGFLKMDLLGLKTLTILKECLQMIGKDVNWLYNLPADDPKVYQYFALGKTWAVFQFESDNITDLLRKVKPKSIEDIAICSALYRPGPITHGLLQEYINRRNGNSSITYMHPIAEESLKDTLGIMIYQEQIIDIFNKLGLTYGEADLLRRAIESYKQADIDKYIAKIKTKKMLPEDELNKLLADVQARAGYSFNKSHAIEYSIVSYWTMYFKAHYPQQFCLTNLNHNIGEKEKVDLYMKMYEGELEKKIYYGKINDFTPLFEIWQDTISFGYTSIKFLSEAEMNKIIELRPFTSVWDFLNRANKVKKNVTKILVDIGMFDDLKFNDTDNIVLNRCQLIRFYELFQTYQEKTKKELSLDPTLDGSLNNIGKTAFLTAHKILDIPYDEKKALKKERESGLNRYSKNILRGITDTQVNVARQYYMDNRMKNPYKKRKPIGTITIGIVRDMQKKTWNKNGKSGDMWYLSLVDRYDQAVEGLSFDIKKDDIDLGDILIIELEDNDRKRRMIIGYKKL